MLICFRVKGLGGSVNAHLCFRLQTRSLTDERARALPPSHTHSLSLSLSLSSIDMYKMTVGQESAQNL